MLLILVKCRTCPLISYPGCLLPTVFYLYHLGLSFLKRQICGRSSYKSIYTEQSYFSAFFLIFWQQELKFATWNFVCLCVTERYL